jgi:hypothetical protein
MCAAHSVELLMVEFFQLLQQLAAATPAAAE